MPRLQELVKAIFISLLLVQVPSNVTAYASQNLYFAIDNPIVADASLITTQVTSAGAITERLDTSDLYRWPEVGLISDPFNYEGKLHGIFAVSHFQNYAMVPSKIYGTSNFEETDKLSAYYANFPPCLDEKQNNCIFEFSVRKENGEIIQGKPFARIPQVKSVPDNFEVYRWDDPIFAYGNFSRNSSINMPDGGDLWMWQMSEAGKSYFYSASVVMNGYLDRNTVPRKFMTPNTNIQIIPITMNEPTQICTTEKSCTWKNPNIGRDGSIFESRDFSLRRVPFEIKGEYTLKFRTSVAWTTWMVSTISNISLQGSRENGIYYYGISGDVSRIPSIRKQIELTPASKEILQNMDFMGPCGSVPQYCVPIARVGWSNFDATQVGYVGKIEPFTNGRASFSSDSWALRSASFARVLGGKLPSPELTKCVTNEKLEKPAGVTGSNATIFEHDPPAWDPVEGSFTYKVAAFSKDENGNDFLGNYSLLVNRDVSTCLWGEGAMAGKAKVEILNSDGTSQVAAVSIGSSMDWDHFQASGFHFSSPRIKISLPRVSLTKDDLNKDVKLKKKIKCIKGKQIRIIIGYTPKCPNGFKAIR